MAAILAQQPQPQAETQRPNALQKMKDMLGRGKPSVTEYRQYVIDAQTRGETPMSMDEYAQRARNALRERMK